jgi:hypothetical protein
LETARGQTLEWLELLAAARRRHRSEELTDFAWAVRAGMATQEGFDKFLTAVRTTEK